jgi:outer membrane immunogenic protein
MKRIALGVLSLLALVGVASAADMPLKAPLAAPPPAFSWTGCYIGGNVGGIKNDSTLSNDPSGQYLVANTQAQRDRASHSYSFDGSGFTGGVQYGCNRQYGSLVIGLDSDFNWTGLDNTTTATYPPIAPWIGLTETVTQKQSWLSTTRARLGWAQDRWMLFVAGGLASARIESSHTIVFTNGDTFFGSAGKTRYGWTVGGGVEYALTQDWFLRGEYMYVDLGNFSYVSDYLNVPGTGFTWDTNVRTREHIARIGLSYRFTRAGSLLEWAMGGFKY